MFVFCWLLLHLWDLLSDLVSQFGSIGCNCCWLTFIPLEGSCLLSQGKRGTVTFQKFICVSRKAIVGCQNVIVLVHRLFTRNSL